MERQNIALSKDGSKHFEGGLKEAFEIKIKSFVVVLFGGGELPNKNVKYSQEIGVQSAG